MQRIALARSEESAGSKERSVKRNFQAGDPSVQSESGALTLMRLLMRELMRSSCRLASQLHRANLYVNDSLLSPVTTVIDIFLRLSCYRV